MLRLLCRLTALACLGAVCAQPSFAAPTHTQTSAAAPAHTQTHRTTPVAQRTASGAPPHAWLFGTWTGGLFPVPDRLSAEACLSQPVVIFTRDIVLRASLMDQFYTQRLIETALTTEAGTSFRFTAAPAADPGNLLTPGSPAGTGFGCGDPDTLVVERKTNDQITFPGCRDFPNPLVRCPSR